MTPVRGRIYAADIGHGRKPWLVVSNNRRNEKLGDCLAVRLTTSLKPVLPTVIELSSGDPLVGRVLCDDITLLDADELEKEWGSVSPATMSAVAEGLKVALSL